MVAVVTVACCQVVKLIDGKVSRFAVTIVKRHIGRQVVSQAAFLIAEGLRQSQTSAHTQLLPATFAITPHAVDCHSHEPLAGAWLEKAVEQMGRPQRIVVERTRQRLREGMILTEIERGGTVDNHLLGMKTKIRHQ